MSTLLEKFRDEFARGRSFEGSVAEPLLDAMIETQDERCLASLLDAWHRKGLEENEIFLFAKILRQRCKTINSRYEKVVDIVGTGGSKVKIFNVSTAAAFVVAGADVPVAKHGNKAATSNTGSADVLTELGINCAASAEGSEQCLDEIGICFLFAPNHHRLSPTLAKVRRGLGFPTIFNCVGPLCNPASAQHQLIGVWDRSLVSKMANALARLGTGRSWIVHGSDGLDEISVFGPTTVAEIKRDKVSRFDILPEDLLSERTPLNCPKAVSANESALIVRNVLDGKSMNSAAEEITLLNATASIYLVGDGKDGIEAAREMAVESIRGGRAKEKLRALAEATNR